MEQAGLGTHKERIRGLEPGNPSTFVVHRQNSPWLLPEYAECGTAACPVTRCVATALPSHIYLRSLIEVHVSSTRAVVLSWR